MFSGIVIDLTHLMILGEIKEFTFKNNTEGEFVLAFIPGLSRSYGRFSYDGQMRDEVDLVVITTEDMNNGDWKTIHRYKNAIYRGFNSFTIKNIEDGDVTRSYRS